jgi:hypothetical protein
MMMIIIIVIIKGKHGHQGPRKDVPKTAIVGLRVTNSYL